MTSILIRLPDGSAPPSHLVMPEDVPILATLLDDPLADTLMDMPMFRPSLPLGCVVLPNQHLELSASPDIPSPRVGVGWSPATN
jgi:hypothetical protein